MALKIKTEAEYQELLAKIASKPAGSSLADAFPALPDSKAKIARSSRKRKSSVVEALAEMAVLETMASATPKKRRGVEQQPIMASLRTCETEVEASERHVTILFKGARLFTLNEIYAILQYRSYVVFSYKKQWQTLIHNALRMMGKDKPHFDGPCKVTLFRQGKKVVDRDSLMVMFKYIIDALKDDAKSPIGGIFPDDNPDIVFSDEKIQTVGEPMVGIRVDLIDPAPPIPTKWAQDLFDRPPASLNLSANQPAPAGKKIKAASSGAVEAPNSLKSQPAPKDVEGEGKIRARRRVGTKTTAAPLDPSGKAPPKNKTLAKRASSTNKKAE